MVHSLSETVWHPIQAFPERYRRSTLRVMAVLAILSTIAMYAAGRKLVTPQAPLGIVSLELSGSAAKSEAIIQSWCDKHPGIRMDNSMDTMVQKVPDGVDGLAELLIVLDYPYILTYVMALSMASLWLGTGAASEAFGWLIWVAGLMDAVENAMMLKAMLGDAGGYRPELTQGLAAAKFVIIGATVAYVARQIIRRRRALD